VAPHAQVVASARLVDVGQEEPRVDLSCVERGLDRRAHSLEEHGVLALDRTVEAKTDPVLCGGAGLAAAHVPQRGLPRWLPSDPRFHLRQDVGHSHHRFDATATFIWQGFEGRPDLEDSATSETRQLCAGAGARRSR